MNKEPLDYLKEKDMEFFNTISSARKLAYSEGALSEKTKLLIALAIDASNDAVNGVKSLAKQAMNAGATKQEIFETLRIVYFICGVGSVYAAVQALNEIL